MAQDQENNTGFLTAAFQKAVAPVFARVQYAVMHYPSKCAAVTGLGGDIMFGIQSYHSDNMLGIVAVGVGSMASVVLYLHGDPKIAPEQKEHYKDPQESRTLFNWVQYDKYPWEYASTIRVAAMTFMFAGGVTGTSYGEMGYAGIALAGYAIKLGISQRAEGSVPVPEDARGLSWAYHKAKACLLEKPNTVAGGLWNAGLVPYLAEGILEGQFYKIASAVMYALPNTFTMLSSKRAEIMPEPNAPK